MTTDVLDVAALRRNFDDDMAFMARLLDKFETRYPAQLAEIHDALARRDGLVAAEAAHRLAGETGVFYSTLARAAALEVEDLSRESRFAEAAARCENLRREIERLVSAVSMFPTTLATPDSSAPA
jgi:HPt (histidine-containing phosphotransfer) domain-containing protein